MEQENRQIGGGKTFSGLAELPHGQARDIVTPGCLVLEGGAFRGVYTQGLLDAFMEFDLNIECVIGVSAGALSGMNYVAGQIGRSGRVNLGQRHNSEYVGLGAMAKAHSIINLDFLVAPDGYNRIEPLNEQRFYAGNRRFVAVATNCETGEPAYFEKANCTDMMAAIKASASMPFVSPMVDVDGTPCLDGGCSCKIPYQWAYDQGYDRVVIVKTREPGFRKKLSKRNVAEAVYRDYPEFAHTLDGSSAMYNRQCDEIDQLGASGKAFVIAPSEPVVVSRLEGNMEKLGHLYLLGYLDGLNNYFAVKEYLEG